MLSMYVIIAFRPSTLSLTKGNEYLFVQIQSERGEKKENEKKDERDEKERK